GTAAPANSPPTNTVFPASARARTRPAFPGSTVEMLVPHVWSAALAKDSGRPGGPSHTEGVVVVVVGSSTGTDSAPRPAGAGPADTAAMPTIGRVGVTGPPNSGASPKASRSPDAEACQYPAPVGLGTMATTVRGPATGRSGAEP